MLKTEIKSQIVDKRCDKTEKLYSILFREVSLPRSSRDFREIIRLLIYYKQLESVEIVAKTRCSKRQCYYILGDLIQMGLVVKRKALYDVRKSIYRLNIQDSARINLLKAVKYQHEEMLV